MGRVDGPNKDGSFDVRPMALNTITYRIYTLTELATGRVQHPARRGPSGGGAREVGCVPGDGYGVHNHGRPDGLDQRQIDYVTAVLRHEWELDRRFAARFADAL